MTEQEQAEYDRQAAEMRLRIYRLLDKSNIPDLRTITDFLVENGFLTPKEVV